MKPHIVFYIPAVMPEPTTIWEQNGWLLNYVVEDLHRYGGLRVSTQSCPSGSRTVQVLIDTQFPGGAALKQFAATVKAEMDRERAALAAGQEFTPICLDWTWPARTAAMLDMERKRAAEELNRAGFKQ